jgi:hypothetical protein
MTRKEIATHLISEVRNNSQRIHSKVGIVAKKMRRFKKKVEVYEQRVGNNTVLTIYIYGVDNIGIDYAVGAWCRSEKGLSWATTGQLNDVVFYNDHFFQRYAERYLKKSMSTLDAAREFYREFKPTAARHTKEIENGIYDTQLPLHVGGVALGVRDRNSNMVIYNTYVSDGLLGSKQIDDIAVDKELNEAIQQLSVSEWKLIGEVLKG